MNPRYVSNSKGFSLLETMAALAVLSLLALGSSGLLKSTFARAQSIRATAEQSRLYRGPGQALLGAIESADIAVQFEHLPLPATGCASADSPCVRKLVANDHFVDSTLADVPSLEFFRDTNGNLTEKTLFGTTAIKANETLSQDTLLKAEAHYATWPLLPNDTAHPFAMLTRGKIQDHFSFIDNFATDTPNPAAEGWALFQGSRPSLALHSIKGSLVVVYNGYSPDQYVFQQVFDTMDCAQKTPAGDSICFDNIARKLNPSFTDKASLLDGKTYGLWLKPIASTSLAGLVPGGSPVFGGWWTAEPGFDLFPTLAMSIQDPAAGAFAGPPDLRRLVHYFHTLNGVHSKQKMMVVPVSLVSYRLAGGKLLSKAFGEPGEKTILRDLEPTAKFYFARRMGSLEVSLFQYQ